MHMDRPNTTLSNHFKCFLHTTNKNRWINITSFYRNW